MGLNYTLSNDWETDYKSRKTSFRILIVYLLLSLCTIVYNVYCIYTIEVKFKPTFGPHFEVTHKKNDTINVLLISLYRFCKI